jgi:hypothetical protein
MNFMRNVVITLGLAACMGATQAEPIYNTASFSGAITSISSNPLAASLGMQRTNTCSGCAAGQVFGNVLYDITAEPAGGTGVFNNIALGLVEGATNAMIFQIQLGSIPLVFHYGDADIPAGGGPLMQFNPDGHFNGFAFAETFSIGADVFQFRMQGNTFSIKNGATTLASGRINVGDDALTDRAAFPGTQPSGEAPEPGSIALTGLGLFALAGLRRNGARARRQRAA